jgi:hypothetical protein
VVCIDAMEFMPPEDWPGILERFHRALRPGGWLYLTVELHPEDQVRERNQEARRSGLRLVKGEIVWDAPDGLLTTTTRRWSRSGRGSPPPASSSRRRPRSPGMRNYSYQQVLARLATSPG